MPFSSFSFSFSFDDDDGEEGDDIGNHLVTSKQKRKDKQVRGRGILSYARRVFLRTSIYILCAIN